MREESNGHGGAVVFKSDVCICRRIKCNAEEGRASPEIDTAHPSLYFCIDQTSGWEINYLKRPKACSDIHYLTLSTCVIFTYSVSKSPYWGNVAITCS